MTTETAPTPIPTSITKSFEEPKANAAKQPSLPGMKFDSLSVDSATVNFSGAVDMDVKLPLDRTILDECLRGGYTVRLVVEAWVSKSGAAFPRDKEGELKNVDRKYGLKVNTIDLDSVEVIGRP